MPPVAPTQALQPGRRPSRLLKKSIDWSSIGHPHPPSPHQEPVSPRTPVGHSASPPHDEAAYKTMGELSEYLKRFPRASRRGTSRGGRDGFDIILVFDHSTRARERRGSKMIVGEVSRKISASRGESIRTQCRRCACLRGPTVDRA